MNVTIEEKVLDEIFSQARRDTSVEIIGLLLGSLNGEEMIITDYLTGPSESSRVHASLSREFLARIAQRKIDGKLKGHILGWYHSHPDYGCFMSDRDIATQENIQNLYEDAVALVIDPVREESKLYRMTGGTYLEVPFKVKENRQRERRENDDAPNMNAPRMPTFTARKVGVVLLVLALLASDGMLYYLWNKNSALQEKYDALDKNFKVLYASVDRVMIVTDRFDAALADFGRLVTTSTSEQLRKSFCSFLITYLKNFKKMNTASLENQFNQKNYNILITEATTVLKNSPIVFGAENLVTCDIQIKELSKIMLKESDASVLSPYSLLFSIYLSTIKKMDISGVKGFQERGEFRQAIAEGIKLNNRRPTVVIDSPVEGEKISGMEKITWKAFDADGTIESLGIEYRNILEPSWNTLEENVGAPTGSYGWDTAQLPDGEYIVRITATDDAGDKTITESGIFTTKNKNNPPLLVLLSPQDNQTVKGNLNIMWNASDEDGDTLKIKMEYSGDEGATWKILAIVANTGSYLWDVSSLPAGSHLLKVIADDSRGGVTTIQIKIIVTT